MSQSFDDSYSWWLIVAIMIIVYTIYQQKSPNSDLNVRRRLNRLEQKGNQK